MFWGVYAYFGLRNGRCSLRYCSHDFMTYAQPKTELAVQTPTASLLSADTVWSILKFHIVSICAFLVGLWVLVCDRGYVAHPLEYTVVWKEWTKFDSYEVGFLYVFFCMRMYGAAIAYTLGGKFRASS